jgi:hypothetical protein
LRHRLQERARISLDRNPLHDKVVEADEAEGYAFTADTSLAGTPWARAERAESGKTCGASQGYSHSAHDLGNPNPLIASRFRSTVGATALTTSSERRFDIINLQRFAGMPTRTRT